HHRTCIAADLVADRGSRRFSRHEQPVLRRPILAIRAIRSYTNDVARTGGACQAAKIQRLPNYSSSDMRHLFADGQPFALRKEPACTFEYKRYCSEQNCTAHSVQK